MSKLKILSFIFSLFCLFNLVALRTALAASKPPSGVTISPAFQKVDIKASESKDTVTFSITNDRNVSQTFSLSVADFNTLGESGGLFFVGTNPTELQKKYGLAKWFELSSNTITIEPKQTVKVQADILNLSDLSPGGHYGALMVAADNSGQQTKSNKVSVHPIASSLLFVTKIGGDTHKLSLANVSYKKSLFSLSSNVTLRFHNDGNTHLIPRGVVSIIGPNNKTVSRGIINDSSAILLPETFRQYFVNLSPITNSRSIGTYQIKVDFRFDGVDTYRSYTSSFRYMSPLVVIVLIVIILISVYLLIRTGFYKKIKLKS